MSRRLTVEERILRDKSEKTWDSELFGGKEGLATMLGWSSYHTLRSRGSRPGYPDRTCWRERVVFVETKTQLGPVTDDQRAILDGLASAGGECYVWRPADLVEAQNVLRHRWSFNRTSRLLERDTGTIGLMAWRPGSLWIPGVGRADSANLAR